MLAWMGSLSQGGFWHALAMLAALPGAEELRELVNEAEAKPELTGLGWMELGAVADVLTEVQHHVDGEEVARAVLREFFGMGGEDGEQEE
jgi:hypothetical protein